MSEDFFKKCPCCGDEWLTQDDFISDKSLVVNGYKVDFEKLEYGLFFFTHDKEGCYSTLAIEVSKFINLYQGTVYPERRTGEEDCPGFCTNMEELLPCDAFCECAFVREIIDIIKTKRTE